MTLKYADRVLETSSTTGTGTINLNGPSSGARSFVNGVGSGSKVTYFIEDGDDWEAGIGTVTAGTPDTLSRDHILGSSNSNSLVNWGAGTRNVFLGASSYMVLWRDENKNFVEGFGAAGGTANAQTITLSPAPLAYSDGMLLTWYCVANITATATINANGLGAKTLKWLGANLTNGAYNAGDLMVGRYRASTGFVEMQSPPRNAFATAAQGAKADAALSAATMQGRILYGLKMSNGADTVNDISIAAGSCISDDGTTTIILPAITKQLDAAWAVGDNLGGRDTGSISDSTWHVWAIQNPTSGISDAIFSLSASTPTMPSGYTKKKRIGSIIRSAGGILQFVQTGNKFRFKGLRNNFSAQTQANASRDVRAISVPTGIVVEAEISLQYDCPGSSNYSVLVTDLLNDPDSTVTITNATMSIGGNGGYQQGGTVLCSTNTSAEIGVRANLSGGLVYISTRGWTDWGI